MIQYTSRAANALATVLLTTSLLPAETLGAQEVVHESIDLSVLHQIKSEAFQHSQVMDHLFYISDVYGPRITSSPNHRAAAEWIVKRLESYGLQNVHLEPWGPFGNSWQYKKYYGALVEPNYAPLIGFPLAWTPGTDGPVTGEAVLAPILSQADFAKYQGKLKGKIVLVVDPKVVAMHTEAEAHRLTDEELNARTIVADPSRLGMGFGGGARAATAAPAPPPVDRVAALKLRNDTNKFLADEGALVVVNYGTNGDGGTVFGSFGGSQDPKDPVPPPVVAITPEHYNRIARLIQHGLAPKVTFDIQAETYKGDQMGFNVVGDLFGTTKKDEIVMLGGHLEARRVLLMKALHALERSRVKGGPDTTEVFQDIEALYESRLASLPKRRPGRKNKTAEALYQQRKEAALQAIGIERDTLAELNANGVVNDETVKVLQRELDLAESRVHTSGSLL